MSDTDSEAAFIRKGLGYRAAFGFPIKSSGTVMAVLEFFTHETTDSDPDLLLTVQTLGEQVGRVVERNRSIASLLELNDTLEQRVQERTRELMQAQDQLRQAQKMEAIGQLTGGVAHDFNNLLTIIRSSVDLLRRGEVPEERRRRYIDAISDTADRAAKLTAQLLAFARRQALKPEIFDAAEQVQLICDMVRTLVGATIDVQLDLKCEDCFIEADIAQFETALINIAVNARDAMEGAGKLHIVAEVAREIPGDDGHEPVRGDHVAITVQDDGRGIPSELMGQIFEPFFTTKEVGKGTGLGLSQVYGFVKQSGGDIRVRSAPGEGTAITLYLPRSLAKPKEDRRERAAEDESDFERMRILVVEDHAEVGEFAVQLLTELGHGARLAEHAARALDMLEREPDAYDMLFTDVVMPGMNGIELARLVRKRWPQLRIVMTSGYSNILAEEGRHGFELLQKPYSVEAISAVLQRRR
jgi:signal transduction histidine kinase